MHYILGIITGLLIAVLIAVLTNRYETPVKRTTKQVMSKTKSKGQIIEPEGDTISSWVNELKNDTTV